MGGLAEQQAINYKKHKNKANRKSKRRQKRKDKLEFQSRIDF